MRDVRPGTKGKAPSSFVDARIKAWNAQPAHVRRSKLGANMFEAHQRLPFALPKRYRLHEDGTIAPRAKRPAPVISSNRRPPKLPHRSLVGRAVHAVEHAASEAVEAATNYEPWRKDLPPAKKKRR